jgi:hypothetical protein
MDEVGGREVGLPEVKDLKKIRLGGAVRIVGHAPLGQCVDVPLGQFVVELGGVEDRDVFTKDEGGGRERGG